MVDAFENNNSTNCIKYWTLFHGSHVYMLNSMFQN